MGIAQSILVHNITTTWRLDLQFRLRCCCAFSHVPKQPAPVTQDGQTWALDAPNFCWTSTAKNGGTTPRSYARRTTGRPTCPGHRARRSATASAPSPATGGCGLTSTGTTLTVDGNSQTTPSLPTQDGLIRRLTLTMSWTTVRAEMATMSTCSPVDGANPGIEVL